MSETKGRLDCAAAEERFSDHLEQGLGPVERAELERHLADCPRCRELFDVLGEVVAALRSAPEVEPALDLAERAATASLRAPVLPFVAPSRRWRDRASGIVRLGGLPGMAMVRNVAAVLAVGTTTLLLGAQVLAGRASRGGSGLVERTVNAGVYLAERKDRLVEDFRILRVVIGTAFEGRLDRMNDRMDDYRRLIERRRAERPPEAPGATGPRSPSGSRSRGADEHPPVLLANHENFGSPARVQAGVSGEAGWFDAAPDPSARSAL
jgi:putative zinc finger protein